MVEATIVLSAVALLLFGLVEVGLGLRRYSLLSHTTAEFARKFAGTQSSGFQIENHTMTCGQPITKPDQLAYLLGSDDALEQPERYLHDELGQVGEIEFIARIRPKTGRTFYALSLEGRWQMDCIMCGLFPNFTISAESESTLENPRITCI